jgi:hypothetical protein
MKKQFIFGFECGDSIVDILASSRREAKEELIKIFGADLEFEYLGKRPAN